MDTAALPTTTTSAEPSYVSTEPVPGPTSSSSAAKPAVPKVDPALPESMPLESRRTATCSQKHCWRSGLVPRAGRVQTAATTTNPDVGIRAPVAVWQERLRPRVKLDFPRTKGVGMFGVVLQGVVTAAASEGGKLGAMKTWGAFHAPGAGLSLTADSAGAAVVMVAYPLEGELRHRLAALRKSDKAVYWEKRPGEFVIEDLERIERQTWADGAAHAWLGFERDRSPHAYLGLLLLGADVPVGDHAHDDTWEVLVPLRADGRLVLSGEGVPKDADAPDAVEVRPGQVVTMPPGVHHAFKPGGTEPLLAVQLFVPPGPEQRFRKLSQKAAGLAPASSAKP